MRTSRGSGKRVSMVCLSLALAWSMAPVALADLVRSIVVDGAFDDNVLVVPVVVVAVSLVRVEVVGPEAQVDR